MYNFKPKTHKQTIIICGENNTGKTQLLSKMYNACKNVMPCTMFSELDTLPKKAPFGFANSVLSKQELQSRCESLIVKFLKALLPKENITRASLTEKFNEYLGSGYEKLLNMVVHIFSELVVNHPTSNNPQTANMCLFVDDFDNCLSMETQSNVICALKRVFKRVQLVLVSNSTVLIRSYHRIMLYSPFVGGLNLYPFTNTFEGWEDYEIRRLISPNITDKRYEKLRGVFDLALENDDYEMATKMKNEISKIIHCGSKERKMMEIQMIGITQKNKQNEKQLG